MARHGFGEDGIDEPTPPQGTPQYGGPPGGTVYGGQPHPPNQYPPPYPARPDYPTQQFPAQQYPGQQYPGQQYPGRQHPPQQHPIQPYPTQQFRYPAGPRDEYRDEAGYDPAGSPRRWNARVLTAVALSVALVIGLGAVAWAFLGPDQPPGGAVAAGDSSSDPTTGAVTSDPATPTPTPTATAKATPKPTKATVKVTKPVPPPPPPPPTKSDSPSCITYLPGTNASPEVVEQKLEAAAGIDYFNGVIADPNPPPLSVSPQLLKAVAFVESSWRSTVIACDNGVGLMQIMKPTQDFVNMRFGHEPGLDRRVMDDNISLGAHYLEYLLYFFGVNYFENTFEWDATIARGPHGAKLTMRNLVIAAYNFGPEGLVADRGPTDDRSDDTLYIPNPGYVDKVLTAVETSPWTAL